MVYIYSTLSSDQNYIVYKTPTTQKTANTPQRQKVVLINGKANITNKNLLTPQGVVTEVTEAELEILKTVGAFNKHVANGFLRVDTKKVEIEKAVVQMEKKDKSAPKNAEDIEGKGDKIKVKTNK